ncbi:MAG TPA: hypothetical protein VF222_02665 [Nitrososphaeraceae archaeon]
MNEKESIKCIQKQITEIKTFINEGPYSTKHTKWISDTQFLLEDIFGQNSRIFMTFASLNWNIPPGSTFVVEAPFMDHEIQRRENIGFIKDLKISKGLLLSGIEQIKRLGIKNVYNGKNTPKESSDIIKIISLIEKKLRKTVRNKPIIEKEIQDKLQDLFIGADLDKKFTREKERVTYSSKTYIPDFYFDKINTVVEVKLCNKYEKEKVIISQINDDIMAYKTKYDNIIFVIYDLGVIRDIDEFQGIFESNENVILKIIKH